MLLYEDIIDIDENIICLEDNVEVRIENIDGQNKYKLNDEDYDENIKYGLKKVVIILIIFQINIL